MIALYIVALIVIFCVLAVIASKYEEVAQMKGYTDTRYIYHMCLWLGIVGYLYVIALPIKEKNDPMVNSENLTVKEKENKPKLTNNYYECNNIEVLSENHEGNCYACKKHLSTLSICKIKSDLGTRRVAICKDCIKRFKDNIKQ